MKKILLTILAAIFIVAFANNLAYAEDITQDINVVIDEYKLVYFQDQKPFIDDNNRTLVPIRFVSEELGAKVNWDSINRQVILEYEEKIITITLNQSISVIDNGINLREVDIGTNAILKSNRVMVPLRFVSETLGAEIDWDGKSRTIFIDLPKKVLPDEDLIKSLNNQDENKQEIISKQESYNDLVKWIRDTPLISRGRFKDQMRSVDSEDFSDLIYFEFDTENNENVSWISLYFSSDTNNKNFFYYDITPNILNNENYVVINIDDFELGEGDPSWEDIRYFRVAFEAKDGKEFTITPKKLSTYESTRPVITLWFDDGWEDNYFNAYKIISRIDPSIKGTIGLIGSRIGQDRYLKNSQILELKEAGWEFVNHSYTHPDLTKLTDEEIKKEVEKNFSIVSKYDPMGAYHFVVPYSSIDERVLNIVKDFSLSARYAPETYDQFPINRYRLSFFEATNETNFESVKQIINEAINKNQWVGLLFHRIEDPSDDRYSYPTHQFEQLIYYLNYIKDDIEVMTPSEAFEFYGLPISLNP